MRRIPLAVYDGDSHEYVPARFSAMTQPDPGRRGTLRHFEVLGMIAGAVGFAYLVLNSFVPVPQGVFYRSLSRFLLVVGLAAVAVWFRPRPDEVQSRGLKAVGRALWILAGLALLWFVGALAAGQPEFEVRVDSRSLAPGEVATISTHGVDVGFGLPVISFEVTSEGRGNLDRNDSSVIFDPIDPGNHSIEVVVWSIPWVEWTRMTVTIQSHA